MAIHINTKMEVALPPRTFGRGFRAKKLMNEGLHLLDLLEEKGRLHISQWRTLLSLASTDVAREAQRRALRLAQQNFGHHIYFRGIIEFTNHCARNCSYCGLRAGNTRLNRYRLSEEEIQKACELGYEAGVRTFILQGGEDPKLSDQVLVDLISGIKKRFPDCAVTLSVGERSRESYHKIRAAGCDRYLLRHETASASLYEKLHGRDQNFWHRISCLYQLKEEGFQTGCGMMIGPPGQDLSDLAEDFAFIQDFSPAMIGTGPFLPHHESPHAHALPGRPELTLYAMSLCRIMMPEVLLPATTALAASSASGYAAGVLHGCNVIMPQLTPESRRKDYLLYDKIVSVKALTETLADISAQLAEIGYQLISGRGDHPQSQNCQL